MRNKWFVTSILRSR